ncbi:MAG TPA: GvpL/GvpF family gas vesicle protein [Actinophytocola sp.]|uniref:GvpL/GvpF family gas vesicle protein n=1 Tax=Actinophytocola sp. TaxID=1872138 RepID=UPI002F9303B8
MTEQGSWVYAVAGELEPGLPGDLTGVAGEQLRLIREGALTAVAGTVPLDTFGEEALRRNLEDLDWLAGVARVHDAIVAAVARAGPTVPFRLATVYFDDDRVRLLLREQADGFRDALARVTGRSEWGVKALLDVGRLRAAAGAAPAAGGAGAAYLRRKREEHVARERVEELAATQADEIHHALAGLAVAAHRHRPHSPALADRSRPMILNGAYLVDDGAAEDFARAVRGEDERHPDVALELTGPWPAYSFVSIGQTP